MVNKISFRLIGFDSYCWDLGVECTFWLVPSFEISILEQVLLNLFALLDVKAAKLACFNGYSWSMFVTMFTIRLILPFVFSIVLCFQGWPESLFANANIGAKVEYELQYEALFFSWRISEYIFPIRGEGSITRI